jgi:hypothetical protein
MFLWNIYTHLPELTVLQEPTAYKKNEETIFRDAGAYLQVCTLSQHEYQPSYPRFVSRFNFTVNQNTVGFIATNVS